MEAQDPERATTPRYEPLPPPVPKVPPNGALLQVYVRPRRLSRAQRRALMRSVHISIPAPCLAMVDTMAADDAVPGDNADRSRLIGQLIKVEWERRGMGAIPMVAPSPVKVRKPRVWDKTCGDGPDVAGQESK